MKGRRIDENTTSNAILITPDYIVVIPGGMISPSRISLKLGY